MWEHNCHHSGLVPGDVKDFSKYCRDIPDFPKKGVIFRDITGLLKNGPVFKLAIDEIVRDEGLTEEEQAELTAYLKSKVG